jgi:hypothetical protein
MHPASYNKETPIEFLGELHDHLDGDKVTIIWDGLASHRSRAMKAFIASQRSWLVVERLPGYAHDLNPVVMIWGNLKASELASLCPDTMPPISRLSSRTVECVTPAASRRTITERRRCRSMPTYCRSTGVLFRRGWVGWETSSVTTLDPSRRGEAPTFRATIDHSDRWRPCAPHWRRSRESGESLLHHINARANAWPWRQVRFVGNRTKTSTCLVAVELYVSH